MATEFLLHLSATYHIIQIHKKVETEPNVSETIKQKKQKEIQKLVLAETIEGLAPLAYGIGFAMVFYGPNAELIGNVKNGYWGYRQVEDVNWVFIVLFLMFAIDTLSMLVNAASLWIYGEINMLQEFLRIIETYKKLSEI